MDLKPEIRLVRYKWQQAGGTLATGYSRDEDTFVNSQNLSALVDAQARDFADFKLITGQLNGQFSIVAKNQGEVWISCSQTWSYPLFYYISPSELRISDDPGEIMASLREKEINSEIKPYFLNFGVTPRSEILIRGIQQVRPGEMIRFSLGTLEEEHFLSSFDRIKGTQKSEQETYALLLKVFGKYSGFLKDKKVLVPVTGGYDSRLIACMLKETGHPNVICATWGRSGNEEMSTAEKVCKVLGFPWYSVPTGDQVEPEFWEDSVFNRYIDHAGHFSSMPYLQDYFAIRFLKEKGIIDEETVVLPGHPGDFLRGSHLYQALPGQNASQLIEAITNNFGTSLPLTKAERSKVGEIMATGFGSGESHFDPVTAYEKWDLEERQCKFIGNSSQVYSFFGINHLMPLFDKELLCYFLALPFEQKLGAYLYNKTLENLVFKPNGCDFDLKPPGKEMKQTKRWKNLLLHWLPPFIKEWYYPINDVAFYREITAELMRSDPSTQYRKPLKSHYYNCYLSQWHFHRVEKMLRTTDTAPH